MTSISATFNAIHPDLKQGEADTQRACRLIECGRKMGTSIVTLCTGTRHPPGHVATTSGQSDPTRLTGHGAELQRLVEVAESSGVVLGIEPEKGNVVDSAAKARRLLQEMQSPHLKIIMDGANLCEAEDLPRMQTVLEEAFHLQAADVVMAHAKDITDDPTKTDQSAGTGLGAGISLIPLISIGSRKTMLNRITSDLMICVSTRAFREEFGDFVRWELVHV